jgi:hypothetical protein
LIPTLREEKAREQATSDVEILLITATVFDLFIAGILVAIFSSSRPTPKYKKFCINRTEWLF